MTLLVVPKSIPIAYVTMRKIFPTLPRVPREVTPVEILLATERT